MEMTAINSGARRNFNLYFLTPVTLIVACALTSLAGGLLWLTALQNRAEGIKERERVKAAFVAKVEAIEATTEVFAIWDDAARKLVLELDREWADVNEGGYVYSQYGIEGTFIVDAGGRALYSFIDGKKSSVEPGTLLGSGYSEAIRRLVSGRIDERRPLTGLSASKRGTAIFSLA